MKVLLSLLSVTLVLLVLSCSSPPSPQAVTATFSDGQACAVGVLATAQGAADVADLLRCGLTLADLWALVSSLLASAKAPGADAGVRAELAPSRIVWIQKLEATKAKLEAAR